MVCTCNPSTGAVRAGVKEQSWLTASWKWTWTSRSCLKSTDRTHHTNCMSHKIAYSSYEGKRHFSPLMCRNLQYKSDIITATPTRPQSKDQFMKWLLALLAAHDNSTAPQLHPTLNTSWVKRNRLSLDSTPMTCCAQCLTQINSQWVVNTWQKQLKHSPSGALLLVFRAAFPSWLGQNPPLWWKQTQKQQMSWGKAAKKRPTASNAKMFSHSNQPTEMLQWYCFPISPTQSIPHTAPNPILNTQHCHLSDPSDCWLPRANTLQCSTPNTKLYTNRVVTILTPDT